MSKTDKNLMAAFAGESQANRKYLAFAIQADKEGYPTVAKLFRAVAEAETVHALAHLKAAKKIGSTAENLKEALAGEIDEFSNMYPGMIEDAKAEGNKIAERSFNFANEVEKIHAGLYQRALDELEEKKDANYVVCSVCGYTAEGEPPDSCPVCKASAKAFMRTA